MKDGGLVEKLKECAEWGSFKALRSYGLLFAKVMLGGSGLRCTRILKLDLTQVWIERCCPVSNCDQHRVEERLVRRSYFLSHVAEVLAVICRSMGTLNPGLCIALMYTGTCFQLRWGMCKLSEKVTNLLKKSGRVRHGNRIIGLQILFLPPVLTPRVLQEAGNPVFKENLLQSVSETDFFSQLACYTVP